MNPGDVVHIVATVLRVDEVKGRVDAQTPGGQLIQTDIRNVTPIVPATPLVVQGGKIEQQTRNKKRGDQ